MKKKGLLLCVPLALSLVAFAGCGAEDGATAPKGSGNEAAIGGQLPQSTPTYEQQIAMLAVLDEIDVPAAFSADGSGEQRYALTLRADLGTQFSARWYSEASDAERFYVMAGVNLMADDTFGLSKTEEGGVGLFGGGTLALGVRGAVPSSDSPVKEKKIEAGIYHDGDWVVFANADGTEEKVSVRELGSYLAEMCESKTLERVMETAQIIPQSLAQGELRLGVEKLVSLGFHAQIDEENGVRVRLSAELGLFTDWLNDSLESVLPEEWLKYLPRADVRYTSKAFELVLAFDEGGMFEEYSLVSDTTLETELRVRGLFSLTCAYGVQGGFSLTASSGGDVSEVI